MHRFHIGYRSWHLNVVMNVICLKSVSVKYLLWKEILPFSARGTSDFTELLSCDLWERKMCVEEFVYSATPNLVLIAWDGFPLLFPHFLLSLPSLPPFFFFFFTYMAEKVPLHQSQWICSSFHQPNNLVSHTFVVLESVCKAPRGNPMARKKEKKIITPGYHFQ